MMGERTVVLRGSWARSAWGRRFALDLLMRGLPVPVCEHHFAAPARKWRFDLAWPRERVAVELDGATHGTALRDEATGATIRHSTGKLVRQPGYHTTGAGVHADHAKQNRAAALGWRVLRFAWDELEREMETCRALLEDALAYGDARS
jgi:very-short-patch-repair endonuclease